MAAGIWAAGTRAPYCCRLRAFSYMFLAFFAWYAALALGGVAKTGQVQLVQPLLTLVWSAALLGEHVGVGTIVASLAVVASVLATQRARVDLRLRARPSPALAHRGDWTR